MCSGAEPLVAEGAKAAAEVAAASEAAGAAAVSVEAASAGATLAAAEATGVAAVGAEAATAAALTASEATATTTAAAAAPAAAAPTAFDAFLKTAKAVAPLVSAAGSLITAGTTIAGLNQKPPAVPAPATQPQAPIDPDLAAIRKKNSLLFGMDSPAATDLTKGNAAVGTLGKATLLGGSKKLGA